MPCFDILSLITTPFPSAAYSGAGRSTPHWADSGAARSAQDVEHGLVVPVSEAQRFENDPPHAHGAGAGRGYGLVVGLGDWWLVGVNVVDDPEDEFQ